jgi:superfamily II DNA or RNA helicase
MLDISKSNRQLEAITKWGLTGKGTFHHVMQFGKTYETCVLINKVFGMHPNVTVGITMPSEWIKQNWINAVKDYITAPHTNEITISSAAEILNSPIPLVFDLLVVDEIHKFTSKERLKIISGERVHYKWNLGLTGTFPSGKDGIELSKYFPVVDTITEQEALEHGWISNFVEYNLALKLTDADKDRYEQYSIPIRETLNCFRGSAKLFGTIFYDKYNKPDDYKLIQACHSGKNIIVNGKNVYLQASIIRQQLANKKGWNKELPLDNSYSKMLEDNWNPDVLEYRCKQFIELVKARNEILINNDIKLKAAVDIYNKFRLPTIIFNESTEFADAIADTLNEYEIQAVCYHSNIESRYSINNDGTMLLTASGKPKKIGKTLLKREALNGLTTGRYKCLSTARALDEGLSIPNLRVVITTAGTANPLQYAQRTARGKTVDIYDKNKVTRIVNLYFGNFVNDNNQQVYSQDYNKLLIRQRNANIKPITVYDIDDIH